MKKITPLFFGTVNNGKLTLENSLKFMAHLLTMEGKEVSIAVQKREYGRSNQENAYYWSVIVRMVSDEMAILPEQAHEFLKSLFLKIGVEVNGKRYEITRSTASLSIGEFEEYAEQCRQWSANELNCPIPLPNEISLDDL